MIRRAGWLSFCRGESEGGNSRGEGERERVLATDRGRERAPETERERESQRERGRETDRERARKFKSKQTDR